MLHALNEKVRVAFKTWKLNVQKINLINEINTEGHVAIEAEKARRRVEIVKKFLISHGHPKEEIEEELCAKRETQLSTMRSFIIRMFFKMSEFSVIPKAFNQLKAYTRTKKLYRQTFDNLYKYMNSDIYWAFKRWKHHHEDERRELQNLSKKELVRK